MRTSPPRAIGANIAQTSGLDTGTSVDDSDYQVPFAFTGKLEKITFDLGETSMTPEAIKAMMEELAKKRDR